MNLSKKQRLIFAQGANKIAEKVLSKSNLKTVFHHHCGGYIETPDEIDYFMKNTDENLIGLCLDTGHSFLGGGNPINIIKKYKKNMACPFKDCNEKGKIGIKKIGIIFSLLKTNFFVN